MKPLVHVIVLNWNGLEHLPACLGSLARLSYGNVRIIMVDNASTDGSLDYVATHFPDVAIIRNATNFGFAAGNNIGMRRALEAGAGYIALLNNDMEVDRDWISALVEAAESDSNIGACASKLLYFRNREIIQGLGVCLNRIAIAWDYLNGRYDLEGLRPDAEVIAPCGGAYFIRGSALRETGLFDPAYFIYMEDVELGMRLWDRGYRIVTVPDARAYHKMSATMLENSPQKNYLVLRNRFRLMAKCFPRRELPRSFFDALRWEWRIFRENLWRRDRRQVASQFRALAGSALRVPLLLVARIGMRPVPAGRAWRLVKDGVRPAKVRLPRPPSHDWERPSLSSINLGADDAQLGPGWYMMYDDGDREYRWFAREASISLLPPRGPNIELQLEIGNNYAHLGVIALNLIVAGRVIGTISPGAGWNSFSLPVSEAVSGPVTVTLRADGLYSADLTGLPTDLSFKVRSAALRTRGGG